MNGFRPGGSPSGLRRAAALGIAAALLFLSGVSPHADNVAQTLPFSQNWTNAGLIATTDNWSGVPGIVGYRGDDLTTATGTDPQTILADGTTTPVNVMANQSNPNTQTTGGVAEFAISNPTIALQGSGTADAPFVLISITTVGHTGIQVSYNLRDIDGSADNAVQPVALQYRVGNTGNFTNVAAGFVADVTEGPSLATKVTPVSVVLPANADNQVLVQIRIITTNAVGSDEWVGIDDIAIAGGVTPPSTPPTATGAANPSFLYPGDSALLTATVTPGQNPTSTGITVTANLSAIGGSNQPMFDDATNGDVVAGDGVFSFQATVGNGVTAGAKSIPLTVTDSIARTSSSSIGLGVQGASLLPFFQDWTDKDQIVVDDNWNGVPGIVGYRGDGLTGSGPQTILGDGTTTPVDVNANQSNPNTFTTGGVAEFDGIANRTVALAGSGTADAPFLLISVNTLGKHLIRVGYNVRDIDGSGDNAVQAVALQYRIGKSGDFTNLPAGFVADATDGPSVATKVTSVSVILPSNADDQPLVQVRIMTTDATGADEWVGIDDIIVENITTSINPSVTATAVPASVPGGDPTLLTATVTPGQNPFNSLFVVTADLTAIGGAATQTLFDDATHGDTAAHDNIFSFETTVAASTAVGAKTLPVNVLDGEGRPASTSIALTVTPPIVITPIHDIQGSGVLSPLAGQNVTTAGIVTAAKSNGFYIQTPDHQADNDPQTSEGLFVFTGGAPPAFATVGASVRVTGPVSEFSPFADPDSQPLTELTGPMIILLATNQAVPLPQLVTAADINETTGDEALERFESMRILIDSLTVVAPTGGFVDEPNAQATSSGLFFGVLTGVPRPMREAGLEPGAAVPPEAPFPLTIPRFDGNPERIRVETRTLGGAALNVAAGAIVEDLVGVLDYRFRTYTVLPAAGFPPTIVDNVSATPVRDRGDDEFTVASFNLERFFDTIDDAGVSDEKLTPTAFANRLNKASLAIRTVMKLPDIIGVEEMENLSTLEALAGKLNLAAAGQVDYFAYLIEGNDIGGIDVGLLVNQLRVDVIDVAQFGKTTNYIQPDGATALLNDRPPLVLRASIRNGPFDPYPVTVIVNHLRSLLGIDGDDGARIRFKRRAQAEYLAAFIQQRQTANPAERIISVGDYNAFNVNDGYVDVIATIKGTPVPADQVTLASNDLVSPNLLNLVDLAAPDQRYSFIFDGNAQEIDHILVTTGPQNAVLVNALGYGRSNADFPAVYRNDPNRPERISDHDPVVGFFSLPDLDMTPPTLTVPASQTLEGNALGGAVVTYTAAAHDGVDGDITPLCAPASATTFAVGTTPVNCTATDSHGNATSGSFSVTVTDTTAPSLTLPADFTAEANVAQGAVVSFSATAVDVVDGNVTTACSPASGSTFALGPTIVVCSAIDSHDNLVSASFTLTVVDTTGPSVHSTTASPNVLWPPNNKMINVAIAIAATDVGDAAPACRVTGVTGNDGATAADWEIVSAATVRLRADRTGRGSGRTYLVAIVCIDRSGNSTGATASVTVPHDQGK